MGVENGMAEAQMSAEIMELLVSRGYLHDGVGAEELPPLVREGTGDSKEIMVAAQEETSQLNFSLRDEACMVVKTKDGRYVTKTRLAELLQTEMAVWGRLSVFEVAIAMGIDHGSVRQAMKYGDSSIICEDDDLITKQHLDDIGQHEVNAIVKIRGRVLVSELASQIYNLPLDLTLDTLQDGLDRGFIQGKLVMWSGAKELVSSNYEAKERQRIFGVFLASSSPTSIDTICSQFQLDTAFLLSVLRDLCESDELSGELHESRASRTGAVYVPKAYFEMQKRSIIQYFSANGYISAAECQRRGVLKSNMGNHVLDLFPHATVLEDSVINADIIFTPLDVVLNEGIASSHFVDLSLHLPTEIMASSRDVQSIVSAIAILPVDKASHGKTDTTSGMTLTGGGEGVYVSSGMIRHITQKLLPPLIETYARAQAEEIASLVLPDRVDEDGQTANEQGGRQKRKAKRGSKRGGMTTDTNRRGSVPLVQVAQAIAKEYPDLANIQLSHSLIFSVDDANPPTWDRISDDETSRNGLLYDLCRKAIYSEDFLASCRRAVDAELYRLQASKKSISIRSRKDGAAKARSVERSFEDPSCFATACYALQTHAKFIKFASSSGDDKVVSMLKEDFLSGVGSDFVGRMTQYCLFKNEVEDGIFVVTTTGEDREESDLPRYCRPFDSAVRRYPMTILSCSDGSGGKAVRSPLVLLRESLSGGVGVSLARAWTYCGGRCFDGGTKRTEDGTDYIRPGAMDALLQLIEEDCLSICGLPFKTLDKKAEKQFLFSRRQELTHALETVNRADAVLELSIMLLFQQVKGLVVAGDYLMGPILDLLKKERKMTNEASALLRKLANIIRSGEDPDEKLVQAVKACGLSRDISKCRPSF